MCRPKSAGGRRCPAHSTPEYRAKENARRRAQYAAKKHLNLVQHNITVESTSQPLDFFTTGQTIRGVLTNENVQELYEKDVFGFKRKSKWVYNKTYPIRDDLLKRLQQRKKIIDHSIEPMNNVSRDEKLALRIYCGAFYRVIHKYLNNGMEDPIFKEYEREKGSIIQNSDRTLLNPSIYEVQRMINDYRAEWLPEPAFKKLISEIDAAITRAETKAQKIVYRGLPRTNNIFPPIDFEASLDKAKTYEKVSQHLSEHVRIGQEMVFDSYLSTTNYLPAATTFSSTTVLAEFLTPHGLEVADNSNYAEECEVLLPRNQRYKIVGMREDDIVTNDGTVEKRHIISFVAINDKGEILDGTND